MIKDIHSCTCIVSITIETVLYIVKQFYNV